MVPFKSYFLFLGGLVKTEKLFELLFDEKYNPEQSTVEKKLDLKVIFVGNLECSVEAPSLFDKLLLHTSL